MKTFFQDSKMSLTSTSITIYTILQVLTGHYVCEYSSCITMFFILVHRLIFINNSSKIREY